MNSEITRKYAATLLSSMLLMGIWQTANGIDPAIRDNLHPVATWEGLRLGFEGAINSQRRAQLDGFLEMRTGKDGATEFILWETREARAFHMRNRFVLIRTELSPLILDAQREMEQKLNVFREIEGMFVSIRGTLEIGNVNWEWIGRFTELDRIIFLELPYKSGHFVAEIGLASKASPQAEGEDAIQEAGP